MMEAHQCRQNTAVLKMDEGGIPSETDHDGGVVRAKNSEYCT